MSVKVVNLADPKVTLFYTCSPRDAVIAAYAQDKRRDYSTWNYEARYGHMVVQGKKTVACGDYCAFSHCQSCGQELTESKDLSPMNGLSAVCPACANNFLISQGYYTPGIQEKNTQEVLT